MKRFHFILFFLIIIGLCIFITKPSLAQTSPTQIYNCQDLQNIGNNPSSNYQLANDIDCSAAGSFNNGAGFIPIGAKYQVYFTGSLDGNDHSIRNLTINANNYNPGYNLGLFTVVSQGTIKNLKVQNVNIIGSLASDAGIIAGSLFYGSIINVHVYGTITVGESGYAGGLVSEMKDSSIINSSANVNINPGTIGGGGGGLVAIADTDTSVPNSITQSFAKGSINSISNQNGGLVGACNGSNSICINITNSYSDVSIYHNCTTPGSYQGSTIGGLIGQVDQSVNITDSYATGQINSLECEYNYTGGLVGNQISGGVLSVTNSYWNTDTTGQSSSVGSSSSAGLTTAQMEIPSSFNGWDFNNTWVADGSHYPILLWEEKQQVDLWNIFSAVTQENIFEPASPAYSVNWNNIDGLIATGVNWSDLLILSRPPIWDYQSATTSAGYLNSINWTDLGSFSDSIVNWADLTVLSRTGINYGSVNPLVKSGINWVDWFVASITGVNWNDINIISHAGINWTNLGTFSGNVNWYDLALMSHQKINWGDVSSFSQENTNWENPAVLNSIPISLIHLDTLRTIGVNPNSFLPVTPTSSEVVLTLNGYGSGTFTSSPAGINCTSGSSLGCTASFPVNQQVTLNFSTTNSNTVVTNWGDCLPPQGIINPTSCTFTPDQSNIYVNIAINPLFSITSSVKGQVGGTISPSGTLYLPYGSSQTFTMTASSGYAFGSYSTTSACTPGTLCNAAGGSIFPAQTGSYTFTNVTSNSTIQATFMPTSILRVQTNGNGAGTITDTQPSNFPFSCLNESGTVVNCTGTYFTGTPVTLVATPNSLSSFKKWSGIPGCSTQRTCSFTINSNTNATAEFNDLPTTVNLNINTTGNGSGLLSANPAFTTVCNNSVSNGGTLNCTSQYTTHTSITLTATAFPGSVFTGWSGIPGCYDNKNTCTFTIKSNVSASANFRSIPPTNLTAKSPGLAIALSWSGNSNVISYNVYRAIYGINESQYSLIANVPSSTTYYTDNSMARDGTYYYYVTAIYNYNLESARSNIAAVTWKYPIAPSTPTGLSALASTGEVSLTWNTTTGADDYLIQRAVVTGTGDNAKLGPYTTVAEVISNPTLQTTTYADRSVAHDKIYEYKVAAKNDVGTSSYSGPVAVTSK